MAQVTLLLAIHNHQPDGNFDEVFAAGHDDCYARILGALEEAPHVRVALHHTGPLIEWLEAKRPAYFARMRALVERGQVEVLGGAFYEPMLAVLPERDARGQIAMMASWAERTMGARPGGMWLAERVWEPHMPALLSSAGVRFTLIDDGHFRYAGEAGPFQGYYVTDKAGAAVAIFPIDQKLRYAIPFQPPQQVIDTILQLRDAHAQAGISDVVLTYGDDGEKFGMWPGTREWVWDRGWLRDFFRLLGERSGEIKTGHFGEVLASRPPSGRIYLPSASYEEMGEWALPAEAQVRYQRVRESLSSRGELELARPFVRAGIWQGFLAKYPEANFMHKKMVLVSDKVARAIEAAPSHAEENALMTRELYRAQCNCPYWHGLFGGLYLNYLRDAVYRHLLVAESFADAALGRPAPSWATGRDGGRDGNKTPPAIFVEARDVDADLQDEVVIQTEALNVVVRPHDGGVVQEMAYRPKTFTLSNVLSRWPEAYHDKIRRAARGETPQSGPNAVKMKEPNLEQHLVYDKRTRCSFMDHFLAPGTQLEEFERGEHEEKSDFPGARWQRTEPKGDLGVLGREVLRLRRDGWIDWKRVRAEKAFIVKPDSLMVLWQFQMEGGTTEMLFAPELVLTLLDGHSPERYYELPGDSLNPSNGPSNDSSERQLASRGVWQIPRGNFALVNRANGFRVDVSTTWEGASEFVVWRHPLETVSASEGGFERIYQGSVIVPLMPIRLGSTAVEACIRLKITDL